MKKILCLSLLFLAGCASFSETAAVNMPAQLRTFSIGEFTGSDPALASLFARTVKDQFEKAGFLLSKEKPDFVLTGIAYSPNPFFADPDWTLMATDSTGKEIVSVRCRLGLVEYASKELSKRMIGILSRK